MVVKNAIVSWVLKFQFCLLLKDTTENMTENETEDTTEVVVNDVTVVKNAIISWVLKFQVRLLLKDTPENITDKATSSAQINITICWFLPFNVHVTLSNLSDMQGNNN